MSKIKLLIITDEMEVGGTQRQIVHLITNINRDLFEPELIYFRNRSFLVDELLDHDIPVTQINKNGAIDVVFFIKLFKYIKGGNFDIIHCFAFSAELWGMLCWLFLGKARFISSIRSQYEWYSDTQWYLKKLITKKSALVISNSHNTGHFSYKRMDLPESNLSVIYNGIKFNNIARPDHLDIDSALKHYSMTTMFIGRLVEHKNIPTLLKAFKKIGDDGITDICLIIVGDGPDRKELQLQADNYGLKNILFVGERSDVVSLLTRADVVVSPSYREGLSNTILESMESGVPVIASRVGGSPEIIQDGKTGILFDCDDISALAHAITDLYKDRNYAKSLGEAAYHDIRKRFSITNMVSNFEETYKNIVSD